MTPAAESDALSIARWIAERSGDPFVAEAWLAGLAAAMETLESFPFANPANSIKPYRRIVFGRYLVVYRIDSSRRQVTVCRCIHASRLAENAGPMEL